MLPKFDYVRPESLDEAVQQLSTVDARVHAGGTDLLGCLRDGVFEASKVVSITGLAGLQGIEETRGGGLRMGALTTISEIASSPAIKERYAALAQAAAAVASPPLRNQGTIGGNICQKPRCWYYRGEFDCLRKGGDRCSALLGENHFHCIFGAAGCCIVHPSDTAPALVALGATAQIAGPGGSRSLAMDDFHCPPSRDPQRETMLEEGDIVTHIDLPAPASGLRSSYRKVRGRGSWDFALAGVALALDFSGSRVSSARVVLSGAAPIPWRSREVEEVITGTSLDDGVIGRAAQAVVANAQPLQHNAYKVPLFKGVMEEELRKIREG